jgi:hypothetical protein
MICRRMRTTINMEMTFIGLERGLGDEPDDHRRDRLLGRFEMHPGARASTGSVSLIRIWQTGRTPGPALRFTEGAFCVLEKIESADLSTRVSGLKSGLWKYRMNLQTI